ncbi:menaquinone biosynthetic enzyme MqnA/MqnD family protein [Mucilaginibacter arboris]|uniref:Chorismate dehydratase n=1 Tax=Mucilaginibacter arboris TaxID=2682090 RepID=A0A7K1SY97_9SPHI|nr:menaquinone biosynthesis protein [Mucilaginibacter arboris]MVN22000.1 radical SAM protein [Mucilaginibacter arboris]
MTSRIRVSAVSYTNTKPFIYGLQHNPIQNQIDLSLDTPSDCAQKLIDNKVDIGLIPVAAILNLPYWQIVSDYCIGAIGAVNSVFIFSNCPIEEANIIQLDPESRSSNNLAKVLLKNYWKVNPQQIINAADYAKSIDIKTAFVQIGDRTFGKKNQFPYVYDLAETWQKLTGLPFVFAAWIANKPINPEFMKAFNTALKAGLDARENVLAELPSYAGFDLRDYLYHKLDFNLTDDKKEALNRFLEYIKEL